MKRKRIRQSHFCCLHGNSARLFHTDLGISNKLGQRENQTAESDQSGWNNREFPDLHTQKRKPMKQPAPVAVIYHGRSNHAHSNDTWSMELARRGYVVLSPDLQGGGESDPSVDRSIQAKTVAEYANSLSYVEKDAINLIGYSAGTQTVLQTYKAMPDQVKSICEVFGPFMIQMAGGIDDVDTDFCLIKSDADQYDYFFIGDPQACTDYVTKAIWSA